MRLIFVFAAMLSLSAPSADAADGQSCWDKSKSQYDLNICGNKDLQEVDAELNALYQRILREYADDPKFIEKLKASQRAWVKFRDAEMEALFPPHDEVPMYYGSVRPMCEANWLAILTKQRIEQLKKWADRAEEGDVCSGSIKIRGESNQPLEPTC